MKQLQDSQFTLSEQIDELEHMDMAMAISEMMWAQYSYNAALRVGNDILSESLFDYMRWFLYYIFIIYIFLFTVRTGNGGAIEYFNKFNKFNQFSRDKKFEKQKIKILKNIKIKSGAPGPTRPDYKNKK